MKKSPMTRSEIMGRIRSVSNMEKEARAQVKQVLADMLGVSTKGFSLVGQPKGLKWYGNPDYVVRSQHVEKTMVFVHGSFWHGYGYPSRFKLPKTNTDFWRTKIERNRARHRQVTRRARRDGWTVITVWDFQLRAK